MTTATRPIIDERLAHLMPPLDESTRQELEAQIVRDGCREPLSVWRGRNVLLDGRHRLEICTRLGLPYSIDEIDLADDAAATRWVLARQLGRRNLSPLQLSDYRGRLYRAMRADKAANLRVGSAATKQEPPMGQSDPSGERASRRLAERLGVGEKTVRRDAAFSEQVDAIPEDLRPAVLAGQVPGITRSSDVTRLAQACAAAPRMRTLADLVRAAQPIVDARKPRAARPDLPFRQFAILRTETYVDAQDGKEYVDWLTLSCGHRTQAKRRMAVDANRKSAPCPRCSGTRRAHQVRIEQRVLERNLAAAMDSVTRRPHLVEFVKLALVVPSLQPGDARWEKMVEDIDRLARLAGLHDEPERQGNRSAPVAQRPMPHGAEEE